MKCDLECAALAAVCLVAVFVWVYRAVLVLFVRWLKLWKLPILFSAAILSFFSLATTPEDVGRIFFGFVIPIAILFIVARSAWQKFF